MDPSFPAPALAAALRSSAASAGAIAAGMALIALVETLVPLHPRGRAGRAHLGPNLSLSFLAFATNLALNAALLGALLATEARGGGLLSALGLSSLASAALAVVAFDFSTYAAHVAMHQLPGFWRFHRVHHSDPAVDVTTTLRQHPGESLIRYAGLAACGVALGASPGAFALYRAWSALQGLLEHANVRMPRALDSLLSLVVSTPNMHKVHHSRLAAETDTNYGNLFSVFDRLFRTFTPSARGPGVDCGLDGFDEPATQTTAGLLALPFRGARAAHPQALDAGAPGRSAGAERAGWQV